MTDTFTKYTDLGDYHWQATQRPSLRGYDPRLHARYQLVAAAVAHHTPPDAFGLDLGCGDGVMLRELGRFGYHTLGLDTSLPGLHHARHHLPAAPLAAASALALPLPSASCDFVTSVEVIEHITAVKSYLREISRVLTEGGTAVFTTPHARPDGRLQDEFHVREYTAATLHAQLQPHFGRVHIIGFHPVALDRYYIQPTHPLRHKLIRLGAKPIFRYLFNPYRRWTTQTPSAAWGGLLAIAQKS